MILDWRPRKPQRLTAKMFNTGNRLMREFQRRNGRWPRTGIIHFDEQLKVIERIEFEPQEQQS